MLQAWICLKADLALTLAALLRHLPGSRDTVQQLHRSASRNSGLSAGRGPLMSALPRKTGTRDEATAGLVRAGCLELPFNIPD